jgi:PAS domain S-box-containing protein
MKDKRDTNPHNKEEALFLSWDSQGEITEVSRYLTCRWGFSSSDLFMKKFKHISSFLFEPEWVKLKEVLDKRESIKNENLIIQTSNVDDSLPRVEVADLEFNAPGSYTANFHGNEYGQSSSINENFIKHSKTGVFLSTPEGKFIYVNSNLVEIYGYSSPNEMRNLDIPAEIYCDPKSRDQLLDLLKSGKEVNDFKFIAKRKDGKPILISKTVRSMFRHDKVIYIQGLVEDISKEGAEDLVSNNLFVWKCTFEGQIIHVSKAMAELLGYTQEQLNGSDVSTLYIDSDIERKANWIEELKRLGELQDDFFFLRHKDGHHVQCKINVSIVKDQMENGLYIVGQLVPSKNIEDATWIQALKSSLNIKIARRSIKIAKISANRVGISKLEGAEIEQLSHVIQKVFADSKNHENSLYFSSEKSFSLDERLDLSITTTLYFFRERQKFLYDSLNIAQVSKILNIPEKDVNQHVEKKNILGIPYDGGLRFPVWQFNLCSHDGILDKLPDVLRVMQVCDFSKLSWLMSENSIFNCKPYEILMNGSNDDKQRVIIEASGIGGS